MDTPRSNVNSEGKEDLLVERFKNGNRDAFDELYSLYRKRILNYINRMIGDRKRAEELTQDVFIKVYTNIATYEPRGLFRAWIYTIASNIVKNEFKKRSYRINISLSQPIHKGDKIIRLEDAITDNTFSPESNIKNDEVREQIENAIQSLPAIYREVIILCIKQGLSYEEAAKVLKTNVKNISVRLARARKKFIKKLKIIERVNIK